MSMHVALLRGINVGGRNKVAMSDLRELCADLCFTDVTTLLQSGNLVFQSDRPNHARAAVRAARRECESNRSNRSLIT
jgi:uncharacterized protein (DUF1697 family)